MTRNAFSVTSFALDQCPSIWSASCVVVCNSANGPPSTLLFFFFPLFRCDAFCQLKCSFMKTSTEYFQRYCEGRLCCSATQPDGCVECLIAGITYHLGIKRLYSAAWGLPFVWCWQNNDQLLHIVQQMIFFPQSLVATVRKIDLLLP